MLKSGGLSTASAWSPVSLFEISVRLPTTIITGKTSAGGYSTLPLDFAQPLVKFSSPFELSELEARSVFAYAAVQLSHDSIKQALSTDSL